MAKISIIGGGFAGMGAAHFLRCHHLEATVFEKNDYSGENAVPFFNKKRFIFDNKPHISLRQNRWLKSFFHNTVGQEIKPNEPNIGHFWKRCFIKHPPIVNLRGLPRESAVKVINEIVELNQGNEKYASNLHEWLYAVYGKIFTDSFIEKLINKIYTLPSEKIELSEMRDEFERPGFGEILSGALTNTNESGSKENVYNPLTNSFSGVMEEIISSIEIKHNHKVVSIDPEQKVVLFENGEKESYNYLISSIPLPELINCLTGVPEKIMLAVKKLAYTNGVMVSIGTERKQNSELDYAYFYDNDIIFSKLIFSRSGNRDNSPVNYEIIQAIIYFSPKYKPLYLSPTQFIEPVIGNLKRCSILDETDKILFKEANLIPFANIIYDFDRPHNLSLIHKYLDGLNIFYCGRYGEWKNKTTDESFENGANAASKVKDIINLKVASTIKD
ncbi:MAG: NAD(P)-binding protein [Bacteroidales bacterium]